MPSSYHHQHALWTEKITLHWMKSKRMKKKWPKSKEVNLKIRVLASTKSLSACLHLIIQAVVVDCYAKLFPHAIFIWGSNAIYYLGHWAVKVLRLYPLIDDTLHWIPPLGVMLFTSKAYKTQYVAHPTRIGTHTQMKRSLDGCWINVLSRSGTYSGEKSI